MWKWNKGSKRGGNGPQGCTRAKRVLNGAGREGYRPKEKDEERGVARADSLWPSHQRRADDVAEFFEYSTPSRCRLRCQFAILTHSWSTRECLIYSANPSLENFA